MHSSPRSEPPSNLTPPSAITQHCLRWREGRHSYRPAGEPIDTRRYFVEPIEEREAKAYVQRTHYSRSYPAARLRVGLFERAPFARGKLVGVVVFSVPMTQAFVPRHLGMQPADGVEVGRLVLDQEVPANGETWTLARAFALARAHLGVRGFVATCDPIARVDSDGRTVKRSHVGTVYVAHNARFTGYTHARTLLLMPNGQVASGRALSKIRTGEVGVDYAVRQLLEAGAPERFLGEPHTDWLQRLRTEGFFRPVRHPGNLVFTWR